MPAYNSLHINTWDIFWNWTIVSEIDKIRPNRRRFRCTCICWNTKDNDLHDIKNWIPKSCGCIKNIWSTKHWMKWTPMYKKWRYMRERCSSKSPHKMKSYLNKWIKVCERWNNFLNFYEDMKEWFSPNLELDRKDNNLWYSKDNCRWVTKSVNCQNRWNKMPISLPPNK